jgi:two-component system sensor histidine kinase TctE
LAPNALNKQQTLAFDAEDGLPLIAGDPGLLYELITNLVANAIQYTPPQGEITVSLRLQPFFTKGENPKIAQETKPSLVLLGVHDSGPGIPREKHAHALARFGTIGHPNSGSGLGLAIVQEIVHAHHAQLTLHERVPQGLSVEIAFPLFSDMQAAR